MRPVGTFLSRSTARRLGFFLLFSVFLVGGTIASLQTGLTSDETTEQDIFRYNVGAVNGLIHGHLDEFNQFKKYDLTYGDNFYGIGFHAVAYPIQVLLRPYLARTLAVDSKTALLFGKHPVVFLLFAISVVAFYRITRFLFENEALQPRSLRPMQRARTSSATR